MRIKSTFKCSLIIKETFRFREGFHSSMQLEKITIQIYE